VVQVIANANGSTKDHTHVIVCVYTKGVGGYCEAWVYIM